MSSKSAEALALYTDLLATVNQVESYADPLVVESATPPTQSDWETAWQAAGRTLPVGGSDLYWYNGQRLMGLYAGFSGTAELVAFSENSGIDLVYLGSVTTRDGDGTLTIDLSSYTSLNYPVLEVRGDWDSNGVSTTGQTPVLHVLPGYPTTQWRVSPSENSLTQVLGAAYVPGMGVSQGGGSFVLVAHKEAVVSEGTAYRLNLIATPSTGAAYSTVVAKAADLTGLQIQGIGQNGWQLEIKIYGWYRG